MHLNSAHVILLLVSSDFIDSYSCYDVEMKRALERHKDRNARVIPIILRPVVDWERLPFGKLLALPTDGRAVTLWENQDEAFTNVAKGIAEVVEELRACLNNRWQSNFGHFVGSFFMFLFLSGTYLWNLYRTHYPFV